MTDVSRARGPLPPAGPVPPRRITGETQRPTANSELSQAAAGMKALDGFFGAHLKERTAAARGLMELMLGGSLSPAAAEKLGGMGLKPRDLLSVAYELEPHFGELGPMGEGLARTAMDLLVAADDFTELVEGPQTRQITAEMLPRYLAEAVGKGQPAAVAQGALEVLQGGFLGPDTFKALGPDGVGHLALLLEGHRPDLEGGLDQAGRNLLAQGVEALGRAATERPGDYGALAKGFLANVPAETQPFWARQVAARTQDVTGTAGAWEGDLGGTAIRAQGRADLETETFAGAAGEVGLGPDGLTAQGRAGAHARAQGQAAGRVDFGNELARGHAEGRAAFDAEAFAGAEGKATLGPDGLTATGRVGAGAKFHGEAEGESVLDTGISHHDFKARGTFDAEAFAGAEGTLKANADGIHFHGRAGAEASAEARLQAETNHDILGGLAGVGAHGEVYARANAAAKVEVEGHVGFDQKGEVEAYVKADAKLVAEVEAGAKGAATVNILGFKFTGGGFAKAQAGVGAEASGTAGYKDGKFFAAASAGVTAKVGQETGGFMSVELPGWARSLVNVMAKTEAGRAAIGAVGSVANPFFGAIGQALAAAHGGPKPAMA